ncbi:MAG: hypothetical protein O6848_06870, partial [Bacteroidetes bacterium]|nr:hypothetical protein [Bacteroidota bacterium]
GKRKPLTGTYINVGLLLVIAFMYFYPRYLSVDEIEQPANSSLEAAISDKSIAVLPFADLSPNKDQGYFSDGMMEEILNHLFKIGDLQVTSRTSAMRYRGSAKSIPEIARELGVSTILEGSVRKAGNRVRITVQLIDGHTDKHLWAETFDRNMDDIFAIQSEVAQSIASTLQAEIQPEVRLRIESQPTNSIDAYNLFLETRELDSFDPDENRKALGILEEVIRLDPKFSRAYNSVGSRLQTGATLFSTEGGMDPAKAWLISKPYLEKALELDPENGMAHTRMAWSLLWFEWDFEGAKHQYEEAKRIFPNNSWTDYLIATGNFDEAAEGAERSVEIDPTSGFSWTSAIEAYYFAGEHQKALEIIQSALEDHQGLMIRTAASRTLMYMEKYREALDVIRAIHEERPDVESPRIYAIEAISEYRLGNQEDVANIIEKLKERSAQNAGGSPSFYLAMIYTVLGEIDLAFEWLEKSYQDHEVEMYWLKVEPPFEPIRGDPRYQEMLDKVGFPQIIMNDEL